MNLEEVTPGCVVKLVSGGPPMTVRQVIWGKAGSEVLCDWMDRDGHLQSSGFTLEQLVESKPQAAQPPMGMPMPPPGANVARIDPTALKAKGP